MRIFLGGHLNFYHPQKEKWLEVEIQCPKPLLKILGDLGIPLGEMHLVVINGEIAELQDAIVSGKDEVKLYPAVGGG